MNPNAAVGDGSVGQFTGFQKSLVHLTDGFVVAEDIGIVAATQNPLKSGVRAEWHLLKLKMRIFTVNSSLRGTKHEFFLEKN